MNKYKDALFTLVTSSSQFLKENKLEDSQFMEWHNKSKDLLQELVDKEAPMKVNKKDIKKIHCDKYLIPLVTYYKCPNKKCEFHNNYKILADEKRCPECGQKLDWGDECE